MASTKSKMFAFFLCEGSILPATIELKIKLSIPKKNSKNVKVNKVV
jgi:hypothetical protein